MSKFKKRELMNEGIYSKSLITRSIQISIIHIGKNLYNVIEENIKANYEGKCSVEGFIKQDSCKLITYSSGLIHATNVKFEVVFECMIACPVEGMRIHCIAKNITKAGIRAESSDESPSPVVIFITRDHQYSSEYFSTIKEKDPIEIRVIGQRFELNDKYISIIASLIEPRGATATTTVKPRLVLEETD